MTSQIHNNLCHGPIETATLSALPCYTLLYVLITLFAASSSSAQLPFTKVADPGDLDDSFLFNIGTSWGDYDDDGDMDLFIANGLQQGNLVYSNNGDLTFTRMTSIEVGDLGTDAGDSSIGIWADIENDGDLDLYVAHYSMAVTFNDWFDASTDPQPDLLYLNNGDNTFTRQTNSLFGPPHQYSACASMADFDENGHLDIMVPTGPLPFVGGAGQSGVDVLYQNDGNFGFTPVGGMTAMTFCQASPWADFDGDGDLDVLIPNVNGSSWIYVNQLTETGSATFAPISSFTNGVLLSRAIEGFWGDYDNDGDWDFAVSHYDDGAFLYTQEGGGAFSKTTLWTAPSKGARGGSFLDYDNDGDLDILFETYDQTASDSDNLLIFENVGGGTFAEHVFLTPPASGVHYGSAVADADDDGFLDLFVVLKTFDTVITPSKERDELWRNDGNTNHWLKLALEGTDSTRSAVGAEIRVLATINSANVWQLRQVSAGGPLFVQHDSRPNFGLGDATNANLVRIEWPSGTVQELTDVAADQILHVTEPPRIKWDSADTISWPASAEAFMLQSADEVNGPWTDATETVATNNHRITATLQTGESAKFYRLRMP